ncbi:hypothetical protein R3P38DRAFT_2769991 [Favolaschia claudopus]|uniref:Uncharacterized protein n=1 Tax=Favolaschia claudopus TaxID=2862362 RepID=A0AAW0CJV6_9AGAR
MYRRPASKASNLAAGRLTRPRRVQQRIPPTARQVFGAAVAADAPRSGAIALTRRIAVTASDAFRLLRDFWPPQANTRPNAQAAGPDACVVAAVTVAPRSGAITLTRHIDFPRKPPPNHPKAASLKTFLVVSTTAPRSGALAAGSTVSLIASTPSILKLDISPSAEQRFHPEYPQIKIRFLSVRRATLPAGNQIFFFPLRGAYHFNLNTLNGVKLVKSASCGIFSPLRGRIDLNCAYKWILSSGRQPSSPSASFNLSSHFQVSRYSSYAVNSYLLADCDDFKTSTIHSGLEISPQRVHYPGSQ